MVNILMLKALWSTLQFKVKTLPSVPTELERISSLSVSKEDVESIPPTKTNAQASLMRQVQDRKEFREK